MKISWKIPRLQLLCMNNVIDHDRLFKELIATFFVEFIQLFFPEIINYLEPNQITFLDKEVFTDVTEGEKYESGRHVKLLGKSFSLGWLYKDSSARCFLTTFDLSFIFWGSWGSIKNRLKLKI